MQRKNPKDLFHLIKVLTPTEKRFIRQMASRHTIGKVNKTVLLFNYLNKEKEYDEQKLLNDLDFASKKTLPELKQHLYSLILRGLRFNSDNSSVKQEIRANLHEVEILFDKGLYSQSEKLLTNVEKRCYELEYYTELFDVFYKKLRMTTVASYRGMNEFELEQIEKDIRVLLEKYNNTFIYDVFGIRFFHKATAITDMKAVRNEEQKQQLFEFLEKEDLIKDSSKATTILSRYSYHTIYGTYYDLSLQGEKGYYHFNTLVKLIDKHTTWKRANINPYYNVLRNLTLSCMMLRRYNEVAELIIKMKSINVHSAQYKNQVIIDTYNLQIELYNRTGQFEKVPPLIPEIVRFFNNLSQHNIKLLDQYKIYFNISIALLSMGKYKDALYWLNIILNTDESNSVMDIIYASHIIQLIIHYEMKHYDLLSYLIRNISRFLRYKKQLFNFEKTVLKYLRLFSQVSQQNDLLPLYKKLRVELIQINKNPYESKAFDYFDFISWLESKIDNKPFLEIVKKKHSKYKLLK